VDNPAFERMRKICALSTSHSRAADASSVSRTGLRSNAERLMILSTSAVAVCCSIVSFGSWVSRATFCFRRASEAAPRRATVGLLRRRALVPLPRCVFIAWVRPLSLTGSMNEMVDRLLASDRMIADFPAGVEGLGGKRRPRAGCCAMRPIGASVFGAPRFEVWTLAARLTRNVRRWSKRITVEVCFCAGFRTPATMI
jgi:hypothetical protein